MLTRVSKKSADEKDRRNIRFVLRGYAELNKRGKRYPVPCRDRFLIEASKHDKFESAVRRAALLSITTDFDRVEFNADQSEDRNAAEYLDIDDFNVYHECLLRRPLDFKESRQ